MGQNRIHCSPLVDQWSSFAFGFKLTAIFSIFSCPGEPRKSHSCLHDAFRKAELGRNCNRDASLTIKLTHSLSIVLDFCETACFLAKTIAWHTVPTAPLQSTIPSRRKVIICEREKCNYPGIDILLHIVSIHSSVLMVSDYPNKWWTKGFFFSFWIIRNCNLGHICYGVGLFCCGCYSPTANPREAKPAHDEFRKYIRKRFFSITWVHIWHASCEELGAYPIKFGILTHPAVAGKLITQRSRFGRAVVSWWLGLLTENDARISKWSIVQQHHIYL